MVVYIWVFTAFGNCPWIAFILKCCVIAEIGVDEGKFRQLIHKKVKPKKFHLIDKWGSDRLHDGKFKAVMDYLAEEIE